jgi:hypothetical protein
MNNGKREYITVNWPKRESEGFVVVMKKSNVFGAKGPYYKYDSNQRSKPIGN